MIVYPAGLQDTEAPDINDHFSDEYWMLPYNMNTYCIGIVTQCSGDKLGYFLTPQASSTSVFNITDKNLVATSSSTPFGYVWNLGEDIMLEFPASRELIVNDTLFAENMTLTASGTNWDGVEFKDGSKAILTNVDILKVGAGAYTGSFTVRDGADVTVLTDSDNIVLGPNFKAELGSEFLASHVSDGSSAFPGPVPELTEDIAQTSEKETKASGEEVSVAVESYPNPFNPSTTIRYHLETDSHVVLKIYNILGQEVKTLVSELQSVGSWESIWDGRNNSGSSVPSGAYIYRLEANGQSKTGQLVLVK